MESNQCQHCAWGKEKRFTDSCHMPRPHMAAPIPPHFSLLPLPFFAILPWLLVSLLLRVLSPLVQVFLPSLLPVTLCPIPLFSVSSCPFWRRTHFVAASLAVKGSSRRSVAGFSLLPPGSFTLALSPNIFHSLRFIPCPAAVVVVVIFHCCHIVHGQSTRAQKST